jgi:glycerol-3-phosphate O-acyltransferase/dihydroxyacetone phosphate acyltransferase
MLRLTAKSTQFGRRTLTSWLIESVGTIPIKRKKDFADDENVDNSEAMEKLMEVSFLLFSFPSSIRFLTMGFR